MNNKNDIMFLRPPILEGDPRYAPVLESLGIEYLVSYCESKGLSVNYLDANLQNLSIDDICCTIENTLPKLICISITTEKIRGQVEKIINFSANLKEKIKPIICVGGHFVSYAFREVLEDYPNIDIVSVGEGEYTIEELVRCVINNKDFYNIGGLAYKTDDGIIYNENNITCDIKTLPWPVRTYTAQAISKSGLFCIIGSRGCYGNCRFCAVNSFTKKFSYKKWRGREVTDIVDELEYGVNVLNAEYILFCDDNFIEAGVNGYMRLKLFISMVKEKKIKCHFGFFCRCNDIIHNKELLSDLVDVGLEHVFLGVESASQRTLNYYNKGITPDISREAITICREFGILVEAGFIMFEPYITVDEIVDNILFLKELQLNSIFRFNSKLSVYYGSNFIDSLNKDGLLVQNGYSISYVYRNKEIEILENLITEVYKKFLPIASIFYEIKNCVTVTWYKKTLNSISDILDIENKINNELTDILVKQITFFKQNKANWSEVFFEDFQNNSIIEIDKFIQQNFYFLNLYAKSIKQ